MKSFFENLFRGKQEPSRIQKHPEPAGLRSPERGEFGIYKAGDVIGGRYDVLGRLGKGGFGVVYLVRYRSTREVVALKTIRHELLADPAARQAFKNEALLWVNVGTHPCILPALLVEEVSGCLFVAMEYVAPDAKGRVTLADHLSRTSDPFGTSQAIAWAIQFCLGMEHARAHGVRCHRDIKPANILITKDGTLKISDFGLAAAADATWRRASGRRGSLVTGGERGGFGFSLIQADGKMRCGTPGYMPPETYRGETADRRSDIYSFGLVLWQMAAGSPTPPFSVAWRGDMEGYLREIYMLQMAGRVPNVTGSLLPLIERCLRPGSSDRYNSFQELRGDLESIRNQRTGRKVEIPQVDDESAAVWHNKGNSLYALGRYKEAIICYDKALKTNPRNAKAWNGKGNALRELGQRETAIGCFDKALVIDPRYAKAWMNKGTVLYDLGRFAEMNGCCDRALAIDPRDGDAWLSRGNGLYALGRFEDAVMCYDKALAIERGFARTWDNKGAALAALRRHEEAVACFDRALAIDPLYARALLGKAVQEDALGRWREATICYQKYIKVALPHDAQFIAFARQRLQELRAS